MINFSKDMRYMRKTHKLCLDCLLVICSNKSDTVMIQQDVIAILLYDDCKKSENMNKLVTGS